MPPIIEAITEVVSLIGGDISYLAATEWGTMALTPGTQLVTNGVIHDALEAKREDQI